MSAVKYYLVIAMSVLLGIILFMQRLNIVVLYTNKTSKDRTNNSIEQSNSFSVYNADAWHTETYIFGDQYTSDCVRSKNILNSLLASMIAQGMLKTGLHVTDVCLDHKAKLLYISYNQALFNTTQCIKVKWIIVESILKTLRDNFSDVQAVCFMVNHHTMLDDQLYFGVAWPVQGFMDKLIK